MAYQFLLNPWFVKRPTPFLMAQFISICSPGRELQKLDFTNLVCAPLCFHLGWSDWDGWDEGSNIRPQHRLPGKFVGKPYSHILILGTRSLFIFSLQHEAEDSLSLLPPHELLLPESFSKHISGFSSFVSPHVWSSLSSGRDSSLGQREGGIWFSQQECEKKRLNIQSLTSKDVIWGACSPTTDVESKALSGERIS